MPFSHCLPLHVDKNMCYFTVPTSAQLVTQLDEHTGVSKINFQKDFQKSVFCKKILQEDNLQDFQKKCHLHFLAKTMVFLKSRTYGGSC